MFNLGLLHERKQIKEADQEKAQRWYRSAGQNGYAAADFHLARYLIDRNAPLSEVKLLLERSKQNGYSPATQELAELREQGSEQLNQSVTDTGENKKTTYQTESWLKQQRGESWTIQVLAFNDERKVQTFIDQYGLKRQAAYYAEKSNGAEKPNGEILFKLVYGVYDSKDKADFARQNLSSELMEHGPWLRTISSVQAAINTNLELLVE